MKKVLTILTSLFLTLNLTGCFYSIANLTDNMLSNEKSNSATTDEVSDTTTSKSDTPKYETDSAVQETEEATKVTDEKAIASHKEEYVDDLYNLIISLSETKPESTLKQSDVDCDTLQWFNATYSMFTYHSGGDYHLIGGYSDESGYVDSYVSIGLDQSWGITDRASAIDTIAWLVSDGHIPDYVDTIEMMDSFGMLDYNEAELTSFLSELAEYDTWTEEEAAEIKDYYLFVQKIHNSCGENGIDAWDYCRIMQISGSCYYAGYLTLEESLKIQLETARIIQDEFDSWEAMNNSYLKGYSYWAYWSYGTSAATNRELAYKLLLEEADCPFERLDFDMKLERFWD